MSQTHTSSQAPSTPAQTVISLLLAGLVTGAWLATHIYGVFFASLSWAALPWIIAFIAVNCWLYVGMFIVAHDSLHGVLAPGRPKVNAVIGQAILLIYAGFNWRKMRIAHHAHHDYPGTADDPDFNADDPVRFWPWYVKFFLTYFGWAQFTILAIISAVYMFVFNANYINIVVMWAVPAILSSLQLFYFGTFLPHRHGEAFPDHHNARTNSFSRPVSLWSCFHFGYHHEHHLYPHEPWWRLPARRFEVKAP